MFEAKKSTFVFELPVSSPLFIPLKFSPLQGTTRVNSPNTEILHQLSQWWSAVFQGRSSLRVDGIKSCEDVSCAFGSGCVVCFTGEWDQTQDVSLV